MAILFCQRIADWKKWFLTSIFFQKWPHFCQFDIRLQNKVSIVSSRILSLWKLVIWLWEVYGKVTEEEKSQSQFPDTSHMEHFIGTPLISQNNMCLFNVYCHESRICVHMKKCHKSLWFRSSSEGLDSTSLCSHYANEPHLHNRLRANKGLMG